VLTRSQLSSAAVESLSACHDTLLHIHYRPFSIMRRCILGVE
jgi:hypothetical protein